MILMKGRLERFSYVCGILTHAMMGWCFEEVGCLPVALVIPLGCGGHCSALIHIQFTHSSTHFIDMHMDATHRGAYTYLVSICASFASTLVHIGDLVHETPRVPLHLDARPRAQLAITPVQHPDTLPFRTSHSPTSLILTPRAGCIHMCRTFAWTVHSPTLACSTSPGHST